VIAKQRVGDSEGEIEGAEQRKRWHNCNCAMIPEKFNRLQCRGRGLFISLTLLHLSQNTPPLFPEVQRLQQGYLVISLGSICTLQPRFTHPTRSSSGPSALSFGPCASGGLRARQGFGLEPSDWRPKVPPASFRDRHPRALGAGWSFATPTFGLSDRRFLFLFILRFIENRIVCIMGFGRRPLANLQGVPPSQGQSPTSLCQLSSSKRVHNRHTCFCSYHF